MLHVNTVEPNTFRLLNRLMEAPCLESFSLVGGTCLSLRHGHRMSVDLDLFSTKQFDNEQLKEELSESGFNFSETFYSNRLGLFGFLDGIKVDFVRHHQFELISPIENHKGIRMFGDPDIVAMKISAILRRAVKKDFWDIVELLNHYSLEDFIAFYESKYPDQQLLITIPRALSYFDDAEESPNPNCLKNLTWEEVKLTIQKAVREYLS
jgi:predicted nucleotidyltransferase component of viral defense system